MYKIALLGQPNSGKSTLFNALTGGRQHVGNWPGKTVEKCEGTFKIEKEEIEITDLPGSYSLMANSEEEIITRDYIKNGNADLVLILADSSQLSRSLYMLADYSHLDVPAILILNMMDVAKKQGKEIDTDRLSKQLGIPVIPFVAAEREQYPKLKKEIIKELQTPHKITCEKPKQSEEYTWIEALLESVVTAPKKKFQMSKFDRIATGKISGKILAVGVMLLAFAVAMCIAAPIMGLAAMIPDLLKPILSKILLSMGVIDILVQIVSVLIPNVLYFSLAMAGFVFGVTLAFSLLEDIGYIARIAFMFDHLMSKLGVQGKSICSMLMGLGCTIGGATGSRVIDNYGQRVLTIALTWAVPCAAIWSIIPLIATMFFGSGMIYVMLGILAYMFFMFFIISKVFGKSIVKDQEHTGMLMELPPYHRPHLKNIIYVSWIRSVDIFVRALRVVFLISIVFFLLSYSKSGNIEASILYKVGTFIEPVTKFFGMGWQTFMAFVASAFAKEAVLGVLNAVFTNAGSLLSGTIEVKATSQTDASALAVIMPAMISKAEALAFMLAVSFNVPCVMALSTTYRETHSLKWTVRLAVFFTGSALLLSCVVYHIAVLVL